MSTTINRRDLLKSATAMTLMPSLTSAAPPSERIRIGFIGCGGRGRSLISIMSRYPDVEVPVVSDAIEPRMEEARKILSKARVPTKVEAELDYRRILDRKDIDMVVIATTQHWHGIPFLHACQAGKSIYVEKPLSHTVTEGRAMVNAAKKYQVLTQMGTQQRAGAHYQKAIEIVRSGRLGKIGLVEVWNYADRGERVGRTPDTEPPPGYHWDVWLGPAPMVPFNQARLNHPWWFDYAGGVLTNWGPHHFDIVFAAMQVDSPLSAVATGGKFVVDDLADTPDTFDAAWEFPGFLLTFNQRSFNNFHRLQSRPHHFGIAFYGKQATLIIDRDGYEIYSNTGSKPYRLYEFPLGPPVETMTGVPYIGRDGTDPKGGQDGPFQRAFIDCVKEKKAPQIDLEFSHRVTVCCQLGNIAYFTKRRVYWDAQRETIKGDADAARMLSRPRRKGYELPKV